jgi:Zn-dependent protease
MSSQFSRKEIVSIFVAWAVLSFAVSYPYLIGNVTSAYRLEIISGACIATATGFILHELGHKFVAIRRGYVAHFQIWTWGIVLALASALLTGGRFFFGAPGAVYIVPGAAAGVFGYGYYASNHSMSDPEHENMIISAVGPVVNLGFALFFLALLLTNNASNFLSIIVFFGFELNAVLGSFNMLPIPPLDGYKVFKRNIPLGLAIAVPLWAMFAYLYFLFG